MPRFKIKTIEQIQATLKHPSGQTFPQEMYEYCGNTYEFEKDIDYCGYPCYRSLDIPFCWMADWLTPPSTIEDTLKDYFNAKI